MGASGATAKRNAEQDAGKAEEGVEQGSLEEAGWRRAGGGGSPQAGTRPRPAPTIVDPSFAGPRAALPFLPPSPAKAEPRRTVVLGDAEEPRGAYAATLELELSSKHEGPGRGTRLTLEQFASVMAELGACRSLAEARGVRLRYGLDEASACAEAEAWAARFFGDPALFARYGALLAAYADYVARRAR